MCVILGYQDLIQYAGGSGGCYGAPVCISERPLCRLTRHLKQIKLAIIHSVHSSTAEPVLLALTW